MFIQFAQQMESLGILVAEKLIDIELVDKTLVFICHNFLGKIQIMFLRMRENEPIPANISNGLPNASKNACARIRVNRSIRNKSHPQLN